MVDFTDEGREVKGIENQSLQQFVEQAKQEAESKPTQKKRRFSLARLKKLRLRGGQMVSSSGLRKLLTAGGVIQTPSKKKVRRPTLRRNFIKEIGRPMTRQELYTQAEMRGSRRDVSENTDRILKELSRIQNKARIDNAEHNRRIREKEILADKMNIMKTPNIFATNNLDFTNVSDDNILMAGNIFKENPDNNILRTRGGNILDTKSHGNTLRF